MSTRRHGGHRRMLETRITRDAKVPYSADDPEMQDGWRCIPVPPTADDGWFILDDSNDRKTEWGRWHDVEGSA
jgi:hypothetical protein